MTNMPNSDSRISYEFEMLRSKMFAVGEVDVHLLATSAYDVDGPQVKIRNCGTTHIRIGGSKGRVLVEPGEVVTVPLDLIRAGLIRMAQ